MKCSNVAPIIYMFLSAYLSAGCAASASPDDDSDVVVNELAAAPLAGASEVRIERRAGEIAFQVVDAPGWLAIQEGVWEHGEGESKQQVVFGEAGHQWLGEQSTRRIDALRAQVEGGDAAESLLHEIEQIEQVRDKVTTTLARERSTKEAPSALAASCNFSLYTGPSGPVTSPSVSGAAALAQAVCSGGCVAFTVTSQACCGGVCSPVATQTNTVCSSPLLMGSIRTGFGSGAAAVNISPPNITQSNSSFVCN